MSDDADYHIALPIWESAPFSIADAMAIKAVAGGTATPEQQIAALLWITNSAGRLNRMSYQPDSERASSFAEGRRFVALQIKRLIHENPDNLRAEISADVAKLKRKRVRHGR